MEDLALITHCGINAPVNILWQILPYLIVADVAISHIKVEGTISHAVAEVITHAISHKLLNNGAFKNPHSKDIFLSF